MKLPKFLKNLGMAVAIGLASYFPVKSQTINGYITDLYTGAPVDNALVWVEDLGESYTDENGFYQIPPSGVEPYLFIPENRIPNKLEIVNILGQKVLSKNISLDDITQDNFLRITGINNVASGNYPFRILDENNKLYASGIAPIIEGNISLVPFSIFSTKNNFNKGGRSINSLDDYLKFTVEKEGYFYRETSIPEFTGSYVHDETVIEGDSLLLDFKDHVCYTTPYTGSYRVTFDMPYIIWPHYIQNPQYIIPQQTIDNNIAVIRDTIGGYSEELFNGIVTGQYEIVDSLPPFGTLGIISVYWDGDIQWPAAITPIINTTTHEIEGGIVQYKWDDTPIETMMQELTQILGPCSNSNIITPSVFNDGPSDYYTIQDKTIIKALFNRNVNWKSPDKGN